MRFLRSLGTRHLYWARRSRSAVAVGAILLVVAIALAGCGSEDTPAEEFFSRSGGVIRRLAPDARAFNLRLFSRGEEFRPQVDFIVSTGLDGKPRMHIVSDEDAVAGADPVEGYEGFDIYLRKTTFWAELEAGPPLYAGTPSEDGLKAYVDFYTSGEPELSDERFWNAFEYVQERIGQALKGEPSRLVVDFDGEWKADVGGVRVEVTLGVRRLSVGVLYAREDVQRDAEGFDDERVAAFKQRFAVPDEAEEQPENTAWGYAHRIWFMDTEPSGAGQGSSP